MSAIVFKNYIPALRTVDFTRTHGENFKVLQMYVCRLEKFWDSTVVLYMTS